MNRKKPKILVLVEGEKTDVRLMRQLFNIYELDAQYEIVSYGTNIYTLYNAMFANEEPEFLNILQVLKEREKDQERKLIFDEKYSDILLIFDLEPQDPQFSEEKIMRMASHFIESSDMGKLYLNYPMVESFYHMKSIPDAEYNSRFARLSELTEHTYKRRVNTENRNHDYSKFAVNRRECNIVIKQNVGKAWDIIKEKGTEIFSPEAIKVLEKQLFHIRENKLVFVLCTCIFFIVDYNSELIEK